MFCFSSSLPYTPYQEWTLTGWLENGGTTRAKSRSPTLNCWANGPNNRTHIHTHTHTQTYRHTLAKSSIYCHMCAFSTLSVFWSVAILNAYANPLKSFDECRWLMGGHCSKRSCWATVSFDVATWVNINLLFIPVMCIQSVMKPQMKLHPLILLTGYHKAFMRHSKTKPSCNPLNQKSNLLYLGPK